MSPIPSHSRQYAVAREDAGFSFMFVQKQQEQQQQQEGQTDDNVGCSNLWYVGSIKAQGILFVVL